MSQWFLPLTSRILNAALLLLLSSNSRLFVEKGPQHVPDLAQELCRLGSLQGAS